MAKKTGMNYLDYVPVHNTNHTWEEKEGIVTINMVHTGFYSTIAQKFFHTPKVSHIKLDVYGSFVWKAINGKNSVYQIAELVKKEYGEQANPLYDRLVKFMQILRNNKFVILEGKDKEK